MAFENFNSAIFINYNKDSDGNIIPQKLENSEWITVQATSVGMLSQIPMSRYRVLLQKRDGTNLTEVFNDELIGEDNFKVAYDTSSLVFFHPSQIGKEFKVVLYYGLGCQYISGDRVISGLNSNGRPVVQSDIIAVVEDYNNRIKPEFEGLKDDYQLNVKDNFQITVKDDYTKLKGNYQTDIVDNYNEEVIQDYQVTLKQDYNNLKQNYQTDVVDKYHTEVKQDYQATVKDAYIVDVVDKYNEEVKQDYKTTVKDAYQTDVVNKYNTELKQDYKTTVKDAYIVDVKNPWLDELKPELERAIENYHVSNNPNWITQAHWTKTIAKDNTATFQIDLSSFNPVGDQINKFAYQSSGQEGAIDLIEGEHWTRKGATITLLRGLVFNTGDKVFVNVYRGIAVTPIAGTNGGDLQNESVSESKLSQDVQDRLNTVYYENTLNFVATANGTTQFTIADSTFNPVTDKLKIYQDNMLIRKDDNYTLNGMVVTLAEALNIGDKIYYEIGKNAVSSIAKYMGDGSLIKEESISKKKLTKDLQDELTKVPLISSQLAEIEQQKASKNGVFSMANMGQDIKTAMTGGSVAVVGKNSVLKENIVNKQVVPSKLAYSRVISKNLVDTKSGTYGYFINHSNGELKQQLELYPMWTTDYIPVVSGNKYYINKLGYSAWYDEALNFISGIEQGSSNVILTAPQNACYFRSSASQGTVQGLIIAKSEVKVNYEEFKYTLDNLKIFSEMIDSVTNDKLEFDINEYGKLQLDKNLFDKSKVVLGYYIIDSKGDLAKESAGYPFSASDYITVKPNTKYSRSINKIGKTDPMAFYDKDKKYISGGRLSNPFTTPVNVKYIRVSIPTPSLELYQVEEDEITEYVEYKHILPLKNIPNHKHNKSDIEGLEINGDTFELLLPKDIYVAIGYPLEIYNKQICFCGNIDNFHFNWKMTNGNNMGRKLVINPTEKLSGTSENLTLDVYSNDLTLIASANSIIHYVKANTSLLPTNNKKILCIGDSLTDITKWRELVGDRLNSEIGNKYNFIGTLGEVPHKHEGHSGWTIKSFLTNSAEGYNGDYKIEVASNIGDITPKKQYKFGAKIFEFEKKTIESGITWLYFNRISGSGFVDKNTNAIEVTSSVSGVPIIPYTNTVVTSINPFYNPTTSTFDAKFYSDNIGAVPDYCVVWLGANGLNTSLDKTLNSNSAKTSIQDLKKIIDSILSSWGNCKVFICYNHYWANQTGLGNSSGTGYLEKGVDLGVFNTNKNIKEVFESYGNRIVLIPTGQTMDREHNYPYKEVGVNNRNTIEKTIEYTDRVHPYKETGFIQFADSIYGAIVNNL